MIDTPQQEKPKDSIHVCSFTEYGDLTLATGDGQMFRFEFATMFGPAMLGKRGQHVDRYPPRKSPFWKALQTWIQQGKRVVDGRCIYELPPAQLMVKLAGNQWVNVPAGKNPRDVRREWFEKMKLPMPDGRVETIEVPL